MPVAVIRFCGHGVVRRGRIRYCLGSEDSDAEWLRWSTVVSQKFVVTHNPKCQRGTDVFFCPRALDNASECDANFQLTTLMDERHCNLQYVWQIRCFRTVRREVHAVSCLL